MKLYGQLEGAALENLTTDPTTAVGGRIYFNTTTGQAVLDDGTIKRALFRNDGKLVFGSDSTASNNVRLHHGGVGILQFVPGNDTTAENTLSTTLAQVGLRTTNVSSPPAVGNPGRLVYNTATSGVMMDTGAVFLQFATLTGTETLSNKTLTTPTTDIVIHTDQTTTPSTPASGVTKLYTKAGGVYKLGSDGSETLLAAASGAISTVTKTAAYTATANDGYAFLNGGFTVKLPVATAVAGVRFYFQKTDSLTQTLIVDNASNTITQMWTQNETVVVMASGGVWYVVDRSIPSTWTAYTQAITASTTAPTKPTTRSEFARWKREGGDIAMEWGINFTSNAGAAAGSGTYLFTPPTGVPAIDFTQKPQGTPNIQWLVGDARLTNSSQSALGHCMIFNSTSFYIQGKNSTIGGGGQTINDATYGSGYFALNDASYPVLHQFRVRLPIAGWNV